MLRYFLATVIFACVYLLAINNGNRNLNIQPSENLLKIRSDVSNAAKRIQERSLLLEKENEVLIDEIHRKSVVEYELRWDLFYSNINARLLKQSLYLVSSDPEVIIPSCLANILGIQC